MKRFVFSPLDILAPWALCLGSAGLCVWATVKAPNITASIISMAVAVLFAAGIPLWYVVRGQRRKPDFMVDGIGVAWGKMNKPSKELIEHWVGELEAFWQGRVVRRAHDQMTEVTITSFMLMQALDGLLVICHDEDHFSFWGRMVTGYAFGRDVAIGFKGTDMVYTASLFRHEVSHQILDAAGVLWDEVRHHKIFKDVGLGA